MKEKEGVLFSAEEMNKIEKGNLWSQQQGPVTVLGHTFENDEERRAYFREELRKRLPELRKIEGFPIGEDDDIINLSDPPYYTACPNPWLKEIESSSSEKNVDNHILTIYFLMTRILFILSTHIILRYHQQLFKG